LYISLVSRQLNLSAASTMLEAFGTPYGPDLCTMLDTNFGEHFVHKKKAGAPNAGLSPRTLPLLR
jgi:hypothetical protein